MVYRLLHLALPFQAYAGNVPVIGDIFRFLDNRRTGIYDNYQEYSSTVNMTKESNSIKITINDAIYDGKTVLCRIRLKANMIWVISRSSAVLGY